MYGIPHQDSTSQRQIRTLPDDANSPVPEPYSTPRPTGTLEGQKQPTSHNLFKTSNNRARARRPRFGRILDAKNEEVAVLKAELSRIDSESRQICEMAWAETRGAQTEIRRLEHLNAELEGVIRAKEDLHTNMTQDREEADDREMVLQQLLKDQMQEQEELSRKFEDLKSQHSYCADKHSTNDYRAEIGTLKVELADARAELESLAAERIDRDLQHNAVLDSKDMVTTLRLALSKSADLSQYIAQLEQESSSLSEQYRSLLRESGSEQDTEIAGVLEVRVMASTLTHLRIDVALTGAL
ncbi:hypothetical protein V5O48_013856 [Marasmius crinis-equi]|uniref:Uncharacterized protein n=1 Tax=Marasmius crinis-equi TaxID=585013 RepID=A0ABR3EYX4_9AGAR